MLVTTLQQWGRVESRQPCIVVSPTLSQPPPPPPTPPSPPSPPPPPALDQIFETHRARIRSRSFCQNKPRSYESISLISYRIFERHRDFSHMSESIQYTFPQIFERHLTRWSLISYQIFERHCDIAHMSESIQKIFSNIWETTEKVFDIVHLSESFQYFLEFLRNIWWEGLWYLITYQQRSYEWMSECNSSRSQSTRNICRNNSRKKNSKKKQNTRTCDKNSPVSQIEEKSHCFEAGVLYSSQRCGDVIGAVSWWRHIVVPVWVAVKY